MKRISYIVLLSFLALCAAGQSSHAQWIKLTQFPGTRGASAYFFNATEGLVGTGDYHWRQGLPARIYFTEDGGMTWQQSKLPSDHILGQVTDIYFSDRLHGWATIVEENVKGWGGLYRSTDGGRSWKLTKTAGSACGVRETKRGVFFTNSSANASDPNGIVFSSDEGKTWNVVGSTLTPLGIDFADAANGYATAHGGSLELHLVTSDSGRTWTTLTVSNEAWSVFADRISGTYVIASENPTGLSAVIRSPVLNPTGSVVQTYPNEALSGGVAGSQVCRSVVYVQGSTKTGPQGLIRTLDGGVNWKLIGGPMNTLDTRFAVTGRGAVVYAFDSIGNIYKTVNGGDSTLSPSVLQYVTLRVPFAGVSAPRCDSAYLPIVCGYGRCDSSRVASVQFLNDSLRELSAPGYANDFGYFSEVHVDTLHILYQAALERNWTAQVSITIAQPDGYLEDTIITIPVNGLAPAISNITFLDTTAPKRVNFDSVSICAGQLHKVTLANNGCADISVDNLQTMGGAFALVSNFRPFVLSAGDSRSFLVRYAPSVAQPDQGALYAYHGSQIDSVTLSGIGYTPSRAVVLAIPDTVPSSLCDSANFTIDLQNVACKALKILSVTADTPFTAQSVGGIDSTHSGETATLHLTFKPNSQGPIARHVQIKVSYDGSGEYDTTLTLIGNGTSGLPELIVQSTQPKLISTIDLGSISICADADTTILLTSLGCGAINVSNSSFDAQNGFSFSRPPTSTIAQTSNDTIAVHFHPTASGHYSANLTLTTSAGTKTIPCSITVTNDPGQVVLASSQGVSALTCDSAMFRVSLTNNTCDSITIMTFHVSGADSSDFILSSGQLGLATRGQATIKGIFKPQDSLTRTATAEFTIQHPDGTMTDTTIPISAMGIGVPGIPVALSNGAFSALPGGHVRIPVYALVAGKAPLGRLDFSLDMNTDVLTPLDIVSGSGSFGGASTHTIIAMGKSARVHLQLASDAIIPAGKICDIDCMAFVSDTMATTVTLKNPAFSSVSGTTGCLLTQSIPDSVPTFNLMYACGDSTLSAFVSTQTLLLDRVSPNPTSGQVSLTFHVSSAYQNDGTIEVYDALGEKLSSQPLVFLSSGQQFLTLDLTSSRGEGVRYLLVRTPAGIIRRDVMILK